MRKLDKCFVNRFIRKQCRPAICIEGDKIKRRIISLKHAKSRWRIRHRGRIELQRWLCQPPKPSDRCLAQAPLQPKDRCLTQTSTPRDVAWDAQRTPGKTT